MKMNNKGLTLIEMLATIILIGIVSSLLFSLINIVKKEEVNSQSNYQYELNKLKFIREIQNDLRENELLSISDESTNEELIIKFNFNDMTTYLKTHLDTFEYYKNDQLSNTLAFSKDIHIDKCASFTYKENIENNNYYFMIHIPLLRQEYFDNLEITYSNNSNITRNNINNNIGICTN